MATTLAERLGVISVVGLLVVGAFACGPPRPRPEPNSSSSATRPDPSNDAAEQNLLDSIEREDHPFALPKEYARPLVRSALKRNPGLRASDEIGEFLVKTLLADRSPASCDILPENFPNKDVGFGFADYGGRDKLISIQAKEPMPPPRPKSPNRAWINYMTIDIGSPERIQGLEDQQVWMRMKEGGWRMTVAPESRPGAPRVRVITFTRKELPSHAYQAYIFHRGVGIQIDPASMLDADGARRFHELLVTVASNLAREYDELFDEAVAVVTERGKR